MKIKYFLQIVIILVLHFPFKMVVAQSVNLRQLTVNEGLPQGQVRGLVQDKQGFVWIATEGLSRYDGRNFLNYNDVSGNKKSLTANLVLNLSIDEEDDIWAVYDTKEVDIINAKTGNVRHISAEPAFKWLSRQNPQSHIAIMQAGKQFFAVNSEELVVFDKVTGQHQRIKLPPGEEVLALGGTSTTQALLATTKALYEVQESVLVKKQLFVGIDTNLSTKIGLAVLGPLHNIGRIVEYGEGNLAITSIGGVIVCNKISKSCIYYGEKTGRIPYDIVKATDGNVYYLLESGLYQLSANNPPKIIFRNSPSLRLMNDLLADRSGLLWAGAETKGLRLIDLSPQNFHSYTHKDNFATDLLTSWLSPHAASLYFHAYTLRSGKDKNGSIWILGEWKKLQLNNEKDRSTRIDLYKFIDGRLIVAEEGVTGYSKKYFTFDKNNQCWQVLFDTTYKKRLLIKSNLQNHSFNVVTTLPGGWKENGYLASVSNNLAYITDDELMLYDTTTAALTFYSKSRLGIGGSLLMALPDARQDHILWIATKGSGIVKLNIQTGDIIHYTDKEGLPNNTIYYIAPDKKGFFWCSSNKGIFRFSPGDGSVVAFTVKDGLQGNEFNRYHFLESPDGHFYFGGTEGYTVFHPDSIHLDTYQPPVAITGLRVNNRPLPQFDTMINEGAINDLQNLHFNHNQNQLTFSFAALQYNAPEKTQYRYRMEGIDDDWIYAGYSSTASYAALPPGHYTLYVNATNTSGEWSPYIKSLKLIINPPWWRTWWMYAVYLLVLAGAIYLFIKIRLHRLQLTQQVLLKQKEAEQAQALEETKSRFFANITHELRTPLTLILSPLQQQLQEGATTYSPKLLEGVYKNSQQLLHLINQLLDMSKLEGGNMPLNLNRGNFVSFIESLLPPFQQQAALANISFRFEPITINEEYLFDSDKLEKIFHNLLSNALKFTPSNGNINVSITETEHTIQSTTFIITVSDTGIGIAHENLPYIFERFYQVNTSSTRKYAGTGIGLSLVKELAELMGGKVHAESKLDKGSVFILTLPLAKASGEEEPIAIDESTIAAMPSALADIKTTTPPGILNKPLILVTDDNQDLRNFIEQALSTRYRIVTATDGEAGLQVATDGIPDLIISDVMMPVMDGYEFCQKIKENPLTSHIGFILLTAKTANESRVSGLRLGADHYIGKPFIVEELLLTVTNLLNRQQRLREKYGGQLQSTEELPCLAEVEDSFLKSVYTIIEDNLESDQLDVDFLAAGLAVSRRTLNRKLSAIAGLSANEIIRNYRLKKAAGLLLKGQQVSAVAYATGFSSPSWFTQCFKEMYGKTPLQYVQSGGLSQN